MDVTRLPALPAGTNNIGDVDIVSLPNEGQQNMAGSISVAVASDQSAIPVSDNGGSLTVDGPLTDAQLRAAAVPVSGVLTDAELRAAPVPVSGTLGISGAVEVTNDVGNPLPVSASSLPLPAGASTSANQATANTALSAIQAAVETLDNAIAGNEIQADIVAPLPAGDNNIGNVDVVSLPSIPAGSNNIGDVDVLTLPALPSGDNSIGRVKLTDGTEVADVLDLTNSKPLTVAIVDGAGSQITSFGGGTQYDEDTASSPADKLTMAGVVRKDSAASLVDTDGDRTQLQVDASGALRVTGGGGGTEYTEDVASVVDPVGSQLMARRRDSLSSETTADGDVTALNSTAKGELYVKHADLLSVTVSGVATATNQSTQTGILSEIRDATLSDDSVFTPGSSRVMAVGAVFDDVTPDSVDEDDAGALRMSANRSLYTQIRDAAGNERGAEVTAANALKVDPSGVTQPISAAALPLPTGAATLAEQQAQSASLSVLDDWDESDRAKVNPIAGQAGVQGGSGVVNALTQRVTLATDVGLPAGTSNIGDVDIASIAAGDNNIGNVDIESMPNVTLAAGTNTNEIVGDVAEDAALAGNPVRMGMRASTAIPAAMSADGDAVTPWANRSGAQVVTQAPHVGLNSDPWNQEHECAQYTTTQTSTILVDAAAGEKIVVTDIQIQSGGTVAGAVQVYFGTGAYSRGTNRAVFDGEFAPSSTSKPGVIMKGPFVSGANGDDLRVTTSAAINPLTISVWFYRLT